MNNENEIKEIVERETTAWDTKSISLLLSIFHPDMVLIGPTDSQKHDPMTWTSMLGKFDADRWSAVYKEWFSGFELIKNKRTIQKIFVSKQGDGAFAVVDIDSLWKSQTGEMSHWVGRTCKTYTKTEQGWKMIAQVGMLEY